MHTLATLLLAVAPILAIGPEDWGAKGGDDDAGLMDRAGQASQPEEDEDDLVNGKTIWVEAYLLDEPLCVDASQDWRRRYVTVTGHVLPTESPRTFAPDGFRDDTIDYDVTLEGMSLLAFTQDGQDGTRRNPGATFELLEGDEGELRIYADQATGDLCLARESTAGMGWLVVAQIESSPQRGYYFHM